MVSSKFCRAKRVRLARIGLGAFALTTMALTIQFATPTEAKTPGSTYCYYGVCHRVKTIEETKALIGIEETITASHYDDCKHDRYNPCGLTSSGERFHSDRPDNTASPVYPDGTMLLVWSPDTGRALVVRVNNAGPYWGDRTLDLSRAAAEKLGFEESGVGKLKVRVIKAPEPEEAVYVENRNYPPVPGDIGRYTNLDAAEQGMAVAMALQASAASPMAPVTAANTFAMHESEQLVAEAPQALGRSSLTLASADAVLSPNSFGFTTQTQSLRPLHPAVQSVASLDLRRELKQSRWGEDRAIGPESKPAPAAAETPNVAAAEPKTAAPKEEPKKIAAADPEPAAPKAEAKKVAANDDEDAKSAKKRVADDEDEKPAKKKIAAADDGEKPAKKRVARHTDDEEDASTSRRSRKSQAREERGSRSARAARDERGYERRSRVAYLEQGRSWRGGGEGRTTEQVMAAGIRAQPSS